MVRQRYQPNQVIALMDPASDTKAISEEVPLLAGKIQLEGQATAYLCENYACQAPTNRIEEFSELLGA